MEHRKDGVIDQVKYRKRVSKRKWTDREYHVQDNADVSHKCVKIYCDTNQFPELPFCGPYPKPCGARGLSEHYHLRFDTKPGHGICAVCHIPCDCVVCTSILDKPWISGIPSQKQARYQPVVSAKYEFSITSFIGIQNGYFLLEIFSMLHSLCLDIQNSYHIFLL